MTGRHQERLRAQGPVPAATERSSSRTCSPYADVADVGKAAKDWPQLNFVIYHRRYPLAGGGRAEDGWRSSSRPGASTG